MSQRLRDKPGNCYPKVNREGVQAGNREDQGIVFKSAKLRDIPGACYPPNKVKNLSSGAKQDSYQKILNEETSHNSDNVENRGLDSRPMSPFKSISSTSQSPQKIASFVDEPNKHIDSFFNSGPKPDQIRRLLLQYRAFILELACMLNDIKSNEMLWGSEISLHFRKIAKAKFSTLDQASPKIKGILQAYRSAEHRLSKSVSRQLDDSTSEPHKLASNVSSRTSQVDPSGFIDVGKIVSSGIQLLFGNSSLEEGPEPLYQNYNQRTEKILSPSSSVSSVSSLSLNQDGTRFRNVETRAEREARRKAREHGGDYNTLPIVPPLQLSPRSNSSSIRIFSHNSCVDTDSSVSTSSSVSSMNSAISRPATTTSLSGIQIERNENGNSKWTTPDHTQYNTTNCESNQASSASPGNGSMFKTSSANAYSRVNQIYAEGKAAYYLGTSVDSDGSPVDGSESSCSEEDQIQTVKSPPCPSRKYPCEPVCNQHHDDRMGQPHYLCEEEDENEKGTSIDTSLERTGHSLSDGIPSIKFYGEEGDPSCYHKCTIDSSNANRCHHMHYNTLINDCCTSQAGQRSRSPEVISPCQHEVAPSWDAHCGTDRTINHDVSPCRVHPNEITAECQRLMKIIEEKDCIIRELLEGGHSKQLCYELKVRELTKSLKSRSLQVEGVLELLDITKDHLISAETKLCKTQNELSKCQKQLMERIGQSEADAVFYVLDSSAIMIMEANEKRRDAEHTVGQLQAELHDLQLDLLSTINDNTQLTSANSCLQKIMADRDNLERENSHLAKEVTEAKELANLNKEKLDQIMQEHKFMADKISKTHQEMKTEEENEKKIQVVQEEIKSGSGRNRKQQENIFHLQHEPQHRRQNSVEVNNQTPKQHMIETLQPITEEMPSIESGMSQSEKDSGPATAHQQFVLPNLSSPGQPSIGECASLHQENSRLKNELMQLQHLLASARGHPSHNHNSGDLEQLNSALQSKVKLLSDENSKLSQNLILEEQKFHELESEVVALRMKDIQLKGSKDDTVEEKAEIERKCGELEKEVNSLRSKVKHLSDENAKLAEKTVFEIKKQRSAAETQIESLSRELINLKKRSSKEKSNDQIQLKENKLLLKISDLRQQLSEAEKTRNSEIEELKKQITTCKNENRQAALAEQKIFEEKNAEIKRLTAQLQSRQSEPVGNDVKKLAEENSKLKKLVEKLDSEKNVIGNNSTNGSPSTFKEDEKLTAKIKELENEVASLKNKKELDTKAILSNELKDLELNKLKNELNLAKQDIELYHKGQAPGGSTAYIVRMRDQTIEHLKEKLVEFEVFNKKCREAGFNPVSSPRSPTKAASRNPKEESEMLAIITEEADKMADKIFKLEQDNVKLIELIKKRDATIFELKDEIDWLVKGTTQQELITTYTQRLKQGEEEMSKLHQNMEMLTKKHSALLISKENEILEVRTSYAKQLSQLINECVTRNECQESEMKKLCAELDNLEKRNFELERIVKDYELMKEEQMPKLRADLEALRKARSDLRAELDSCNQQIKETQREIVNLRKEKVDLEEKHSADMAALRNEVLVTKTELETHESKSNRRPRKKRKMSNKKAALHKKELENEKLKKELNEMAAKVQERDGSVAHWKIKADDINRQMHDIEERHALSMKDDAQPCLSSPAKNKEIANLAKQVEGMSHELESASSVSDKEVFKLQSQLKELQRQHLGLAEQNESALRLKEEEIKRLYAEIGQLSAQLAQSTKDKEAEVNRLKSELKAGKEATDAIIAEFQANIQHKQNEIRKLMSGVEHMEVEAAKLHSAKEQEVVAIQKEYKHKMEQFTTDRAHLLAVKDNEIKKLKDEIDRLLNEARDGGLSIADMKKKVFSLEQDKTELLLLKDQWQADMDKLYMEYKMCKDDRDEFQEMVDRISKEMEERIEGLKDEHENAIRIKDNQIRDLYIKLTEQVERIAKDRGEMSAHLHKVLQEKEDIIAELYNKLKEYDACLDQAENAFKLKLQKKSEEIKWLREEIRKMGSEGVRLLDMREKEISEMKDHLKNMLRVMESKSKTKVVPSKILICRPPQIKTQEPHLKAAVIKSKKTQKRCKPLGTKAKSRQ